MKILNQIIILIVFLGLIFAAKSDYKSLYTKAVSYLQNEVVRSYSVGKDNLIEEVKNLNNSVDFTNEVKTPGALIVSDNLLSSNIKNIKLTSKGVIDITNKYRNENGGLAPLKENSKLNFSAEKKLQDMFMKEYFEHESPDGVGVGDLGNQVSYEYIIIGENLALGNFKDDLSLVDAWMASPGHKANILNKRYTEIGVAVGKGTYQGKSVWMAVQHFALPKSACPSIDQVLKGVIDLDQERIKSMEKDLANRRISISNGVVKEGMTTNDQIDTYNNLVSDYNNLILNIKEKINKYNIQVKNFNICIADVN